MALDYSTPPDLPVASDVLPTQYIAEGAIDDIANCQNYALAHIGTGVVIQQEWPEDPIQYTGALSGVLTKWRVPVITGQHVVLRLHARLDHAVTAGDVRFYSATAADSVTIASIGDPTSLEGGLDLDIDDSGDGFEYITMKVSGTDGAGIVYQVVGEIIAVASPLAAAALGDGEPLGRGASLAPDRALDAGRGARMVRNIAQGNDQTRTMACWSTVRTADSGNIPTWPSYGLRAIGLSANRGVAAEYTAAFLCSGKAADADIYVDDPQRTLTVAAAAAEDWRTLTDTQARPDGALTSPDGSMVLRHIDVRDAATNSVPATTVVGLLAVTVTGP